MTWYERHKLRRALRPKPTPEEVFKYSWLRVAFWLLFLLVFVILPILRPLWS